MAMKYPTKYKDHNESLERFTEKFNTTGDPSIHVWLPPCENYYDDGTIYIDDDESMISYRILFDWEKRHTHYNTKGKFPFRTLTQLGRKIAKPKISLSLQTSTDESGLMVAFHSDFDEDNWRYQWVTNEAGERFLEKVFETTFYKEYDLTSEADIIELKAMIQRAILSHQLNHTIF